MKELALFSEDNGQATSYTYGNNPNEPRTWDADRIHGCLCDKGYAGHDCSLKKCPYGDDPSTYDQHVEVQLLTCKAETGNIKLTFRQETTKPIPVDADASTVKAALMELPSLRSGGVTWQKSSVARVSKATNPDHNKQAVPLVVENGQQLEKPHDPIRVFFTLDNPRFAGMKGLLNNSIEANKPLKPPPRGNPFYLNVSSYPRVHNSTVCNKTHSNVIIISFDGIHGDLPALTADTTNATYTSGTSQQPGVVNVYQDGAEVGGLKSIKGTTEWEECNNRGICDRSKGKCKCFPTYSSSDGRGNAGYIGDCGYRLQKDDYAHGSFGEGGHDIISIDHKDTLSV
jgi:hypothetical protein